MVILLFKPLRVKLHLDLPSLQLLYTYIMEEAIYCENY